MTEWLRCDDCGADRQGRVGQSLDDLREKLAAVGWVSNKAQDRDLCPRCVAARGLAVSW